MFEKDPTILEELSTFFFKIFIPAFIAISIKIATQIKKEKMNFGRIVISFIVGIGCAYFVFPFVEGKWTPLIVGVVAMSGEKISEFIIYKWDVDTVLKTLISNWITKK
jgi:hypothetical protein|tara:strand:+ start:123 stop:446 length:324 start_codon:yes stop_codon:yes gene_type:complete